MNSTLFSSIFLLILFNGFNLYGQIDNDKEGGYPILMPAKGHTGAVSSVEVSPDKKHILTASENDFTAKVWDLTSGKVILDIIGHTRAVWSAKYSPDGKFILTASLDGTAKEWDARSGNLVRDFIGHKGGVREAIYSPKGNQILTTDTYGSANIWKASSGELLYNLNGHTDIIYSAKYSSDGRQILTASGDSTAKMWNARSGELLLSLNGHNSYVNSTAFSPDGRQILTASGDSTAKMWDARSGDLLLSLNGHNSGINSVCFSPDGRYILTASMDSTVNMWDALSGKLLFNLRGHTAEVSSATFSFDGSQILSNSWDGKVVVWDASTGELLFDLFKSNYGAWLAKYSVDGKYIFTSNWDFSVKVLDANSGKQLYNLVGYTSGIIKAQYSENKNYILTHSIDNTSKIWNAKTGDLLFKYSNPNSTIGWAEHCPKGEYFFQTKNNGELQVRSANSEEFKLDLVGHTSWVYSIYYSHNRKHILTASADKTVKIWNAESGKLLFNLTGHTNDIRSAQYSPDGKHILTISEDSTAKVWNANSGELLLNFNRHNAGIRSAQFSPDGNHILSKSKDGNLKVWNSTSGELLLNLMGSIWSVDQFSSNGKHILTISRDGIAKIWNFESGELLFNICGSDAPVSSVKYSADGNFILITDDDNTVKVWDATSRKLLLNLVGHTSWVNSPQYSLNRKHILTASQDGSMIMWEASTGKKLLTLYPLGKDNWVVIHPSGLFDASPKAMEWMYYLIGQEVIELDQLKDRYFEPGLYEKVMAGEILRDVEAFEKVAMYPEIKSSIEENELNIQLKERNGGIGKISLSINNKEVIPDANAHLDTLLNIDLTQFEKYYLRDTINTVSFRAYNDKGWLKSTSIDHLYIPEFISQKGKQEDEGLIIGLGHDPHLYAVVVGTSDYVGENLDLQFADKDSKDIASSIEQSAKLLFGVENVHMDWFTSTSMEGSKTGTKKNIKMAIDSIAKKASAEDVLLFYFSGHGVTYGSSFENEQFYYLTKDMYSGELTDPQIRENYSISTEEMTEWINGIAAQKQVMILDACSSGNVVEDLLAVRNVPTSQIRALDRMKDRTGMFVLAGSAAEKVSYEASQFGQGLLTYSLLLGMSGAALKDGQSVDIMNLFQFARDQVPEFARDIGGVQTPTLAIPTDASSFDIGLVTDEIEIPLQQVKPLFTRSNFQEEESFRDIIRLSKALDNHLIDASSGPTSRGVIFIDVDEYENAYSVNGRYIIEEDKISLQGRLYKGKEKLGDLDISGDINYTEKLVNKILDEIVDIINQN